jgi:Raf kinase inhibitor-like YbhB/YbcL family protein
MVLSLASLAFQDGGSIPSKFTCDDQRELSPALSIAGVPAGVVSLALIMDDPDIPAHVKRPDFQEFDHWVLFDLPAGTREIPEGDISAGTTGLNSAGNSAYTGPCPPPQYEPSEHRYIFTVYALDTMLGLSASTTKAQLIAAMAGHVIAQAQLLGRYKRQ